MSSVRQAAFTGGEWAPGLWGRTSAKGYANALRLCKNHIPRQEGPLSNRSGLRYQGSAKEAVNPARLIPFVFSSGTISNAFVLEVGTGYIRVWKNGARISMPDIVTDYTADEVGRIKFTQSGQVMTFCCKQKITRELTWLADAQWTWQPFSILRTLAAPTALAVTLAPPATATVAAKEQVWVVTAVDAEDRESLPCGYAGATCALSQNTPGTIMWQPVTGADHYNVYRGRNGMYGYIGSTPNTEFHDDGQYPVYAEAPPGGRDPFPAAKPDFQPQIVTYHDQRLVFGNMWNSPAGIEMSMTGEYKNFDRAKPPKASDAVSFNVVGTRYEEIRSLVSHGDVLVAFTNATELPITGSEGVVMQDDIVFLRPTHWGCSWLDPITIGDAIIYTQDVGGSIREYIPESPQQANDLSLLAQHLFQGHSIVSWAYQHEPFRVIWAVRDDGVLLSCTYIRAMELWAMAQHDTGDGDLFESVCVVPEGQETAAYFLVKRMVNGQWRRHFERLTPRVGIDRVSGVFLDAAITSTGKVINGLGHLEGREVYALVDGMTYGPFVVQAGAITLPVTGTVVHVGLSIDARWASLDMFSTQDEIRPRQKTVRKVYLEVLETATFRAGQTWQDTLMKWERVGLFSGLAEIAIDTTWDTSGAVVVQVDEPLPFTALSLIREVDW
jgi:hypothetical protein